MLLLGPREGLCQAGIRGLSPAPANLPFTLAYQVATQFKMSLLQLVEILQSKEPAYIRCIKPNDAKQPGRPLPSVVLWGRASGQGPQAICLCKPLIALLPLLQAALMRC